MVQQQFEQRKLSSRKVSGLAPKHYLALAAIIDDIPQPFGVRQHVGPAAGQGVKPGEQLLHLEGLDQIVVRTRIQSRDAF